MGIKQLHSKAFIERQNKHKTIKRWMALGHFERAAEEALEALKLHGSHVGLRADLAVCFYRIGNLHKWRLSLQELAQEFQLCRNQLSMESRLRTALILAKFYEEIGEIALAIHQLEQEIATMENLGVKDEIQLKILANFLRIQSLVGLSLGQSQVRRDLELSKHLCSDSTQVELEHSLMLHDLELVGPSAAQNRLLSLIANQKLDSYDTELFLYDYIEACLTFGHTNFLKQVSQLLNIPTSSDFGHILKSWLQQPSVNHWVWPVNTNQLTASEFIRLSSLFLAHASSEKSTELRTQLAYQLFDLSEESQAIWKRRKKVSSKKSIMTLDDVSKTLLHQDKRLSFKNKPVAFQFLSLLKLRPQWPTDTFCRHMFSLDLSEDQYTRIRVMVHRMNKNIADEFQLEKIIHLNQQTITLNENVQIKG